MWDLYKFGLTVTCTLTLTWLLQVGFSKSGKVLALDCKLYNNAGNGLDLSAAIMDRALLHTDAAYKIPHVRVVGYCCKTNIASNTAFRGFGGPQVSVQSCMVILFGEKDMWCSWGDGLGEEGA